MERRLEMERRDVIGRGADLRVVQRGDDAVALRRAADEEVVDVAGLVLRKVDEIAETELRVPRGGLTPSLRPPVELCEKDTEERGLQLVEPRVVADEVEVDLVRRAVERKHAHALEQRLVVRRDETAVADAKEVLRREEAERRDVADLRDAGRAERLRGVLDHRHAELRQLDGGSGTAEQVHRHDRARARRDPRRDVVDVDVQRHGIDVGEDRGRAAAGDRLRGRVERERRADHLVAGADLHRVEDEHERIGAVGDADASLHAEVGGRLVLECVEVRALDVPAAVEDLGEPRLDLRAHGGELALDVNEWYRLLHGVSL
jgi:hypothetical protein